MALLGTKETLRVEDFGLGVVDVVKILMGLLLLPKHRLFVVVDTVVVAVDVCFVVGMVDVLKA